MCLAASVELRVVGGVVVAFCQELEGFVAEWQEVEISFVVMDDM